MTICWTSLTLIITKVVLTLRLSWLFGCDDSHDEPTSEFALFCYRNCGLCTAKSRRGKDEIIYITCGGLLMTKKWNGKTCSSLLIHQNINKNIYILYSKCKWSYQFHPPHVIIQASYWGSITCLIFLQHIRLPSISSSPHCHWYLTMPQCYHLQRLEPSPCNAPWFWPPTVLWGFQRGETDLKGDFTWCYIVME